MSSRKQPTPETRGASEQGVENVVAVGQRRGGLKA